MSVISFNTYLLEKQNLVMRVSSIGEENCNYIVNAHDSKQEDKEGTRGIVIHLHESLPVYCDEEQVKAAHDKVDKNATEMHSSKGRVDNPQVNQLKQACQRSKQEKLDEAYQALAYVQVVKSFSLLQSFLIWLDDWELWRRTTGIHFLFILIEFVQLSKLKPN